MSQIKEVLKARFRGDKSSERKGSFEDDTVIKGERVRDSASPSKESNVKEEEQFELINVHDKGDSTPMTKTKLSTEQSPKSSPSIRRASAHSTESFRDMDEKNIFEQQLNQLQEQLVSVMIENQSLASELKEYKEKSSMEKLKQELEYEKRKSALLTEKCVALENKKKSRNFVQRSKSDASTLQSAIEVALDASKVTDQDLLDTGDHIPVKTVFGVPPAKPKKKSRMLRLWEYILDIVYDLLEDFSDVPEPDVQEEDEGDPLTVKTLKDNIKRFGAAVSPYIDTGKGLLNLLTWKSPAYTLVVFTMYIYCLWQGLLLPVVLFLMIFKLSVTYFRHRGWSFEINFLHSGEQVQESEDKDLGVSDKFNLVVHVARKVQNTLGVAADSLEKIKSLFTWRYFPATKQLFFTILLGFVLSCCFKVSSLFYIGGFYCGIKLFIVDFFYRRYPRLKEKYDSTTRMWKKLPTDSEYAKRHVRSEIDKYILPRTDLDEDLELEIDAMSRDDKSFCDLFSLPPTEGPLSGWHGGKRCTLINREKSLTSAFKNGKLYLSRSFLCFERTKHPSPKNIVIPLSDIKKLEKAKPYGWLPGGGMSIEVTLIGSEKTYLFAALINREEAFDSILFAGRKANLPWSEDRTSPSQTS